MASAGRGAAPPGLRYCGGVTVPPLIPRDPVPRRRRRRRSPALLLLVVLLAVVAVAAVAVAGVAVLRRQSPDHTDPAAAVASSRPAAEPSSGSVAASPSSSASPSGQPGKLPPRPHIVAHPTPVPILVYHRIVAKPKGPPLTFMSTRLFRQQMAWLARSGYEAVTLRRVYQSWTGDAILPPKPIVLSFDDGYADQVRNAAPIIQGYQWPAELDLVSTALYLGDDPPATSLTPEMVQSLLDDGWELESHSVNHLDLTDLWGEKLRHELDDSRARLEELFHVKVDFFCYPGGIYNKRVKLATRRAGYLAATGTRYGAATPRDLFSLARIYAYGGESMASFGSRLDEILAAEQD
jgi:peptidoglycan/xylan/chitin deacetylase (PgdA/CDA1 family)